MLELVVILIFMVMVVVSLCLVAISLKRKIEELEKILGATQKELESTKEYFCKVITNKTYFDNF